MKKLISTTVAAVLLAATMAMSPAVAQWGKGGSQAEKDRYLENYYERNAKDDDYWRWKKRQWRDDDYGRWYQHRHSNGGEAAAAAIFGLAAGAIAGAAAAGAGASNYDAHQAACFNRYRSYDPVSDTYLGHDGYRHPCRL